MKRISILLVFLLAFIPITSYAAPIERVQNEGGQVQRSIDKHNKENVRSIKVTPPVEKKNIKQIFKAAAEYEKQELILSFSENTSVDKRQEILKKFDLTVENQMQNYQFVLVTVPKGQNLQDIAQKLVQYKELLYVQPSTSMKQQYVSQEPYYARQWYLPKLEMPKAWDITRGYSEVVVAVIDGGVETNHPDLKNSVLSPVNMVDPSDPDVESDHGTHVAGIIAAAFNKYGTAGIAPNTKIMPINVFEGEDANPFVVAMAIQYAANNGADIINLSLGGYQYVYVVDYAIQYAINKGVTVIAAAGNESTSLPSYPASNKNVIGVGATRSNDTKVWFSNYGSYIDVTAPGENILSTVTGGGYAVESGTSMARRQLCQAWQH